MNYKFAFVLQDSKEYLNRNDLEKMLYLKPDELKFQFDENGIVFIEEDVNCPKADKTVTLLMENNIQVYHINAVKWKDFPKITN